GALAADRAVQLGDAEPGPRPALRALRSTREDTLRVGQSAKTGVQMLRVGDQAAVRIGQQVRHAAVDRHDRPGSPRRLWHLLLTLDRHEPLIHVAGERAAAAPAVLAPAGGERLGRGAEPPAEAR